MAHLGSHSRQLWRPLIGVLRSPPAFYEIRCNSGALRVRLIGDAVIGVQHAIAKELNNRRIRTPTGKGKWYSVQVRRGCEQNFRASAPQALGKMPPAIPVRSSCLRERRSARACLRSASR
jgi:hypothetical protein